jgi:hypothetical protein
MRVRQNAHGSGDVQVAARRFRAAIALIDENFVGP